MHVDNSVANFLYLLGQCRCDGLARMLEQTEQCFEVSTFHGNQSTNVLLIKVRKKKKLENTHFTFNTLKRVPEPGSYSIKSTG